MWRPAHSSPRGSTAFEDTRYGDALVHFQRAYELSQRSVLLYNVGVSADRLRRDDVALAAFERFLREVPVHPRRREVEARVVVLRASVAASAQPGATAPRPGENTGAQPTAAENIGVRPTGSESVANGSAADENTGASTAGSGTGARSTRVSEEREEERESDGPGVLSIAGPITLGALGVARVVAAIFGLAGAGECLALEGALCVEERQTSWVGVGVYGGLGLASLAGALIWLLVAMGGDDDTSDDTVALTPNGVAVRWSL